MSLRQLKKEIHDRLRQDDLDQALAVVKALPARQAVNPLLGLLHDRDPLVRWRAVSAMGVVVAGLAEGDMESARVVMRRLIWQLNDESGGIGWGCPESMGEIMARHAGLAAEYARILVSYIMPDGNFIEHELLQRGVLWGIGRLARARPKPALGARGLLMPYLLAPDPALRGLAARIAGALGDATARLRLQVLLNDTAVLDLYQDGRLHSITVGQLAAEALAAITN